MCWFQRLTLIIITYRIGKRQSQRYQTDRYTTQQACLDAAKETPTAPPPTALLSRPTAFCGKLCVYFGGQYRCKHDTGRDCLSHSVHNVVWVKSFSLRPVNDQRKSLAVTFFYYQNNNLKLLHVLHCSVCILCRVLLTFCDDHIITVFMYTCR